MTKSELIIALSEEMGFSFHESREVVNTILDAMSEALGRGEGIELRGFGSFSVRQYGSYEGRNPKNGAYVAVKPKRLPFFKVSKGLREAVDRNK